MPSSRSSRKASSTSPRLPNKSGTSPSLLAPDCQWPFTPLSDTAALVEDLRRIDGQLRETRKKLDTAVRASGTSLTGLFGVGPVTAATIIGEVRDVSRFKDRGFAAYSGTAPILAYQDVLSSPNSGCSGFLLAGQFARACDTAPRICCSSAPSRTACWTKAAGVRAEKPLALGVGQDRGCLRDTCPASASGADEPG